MAGSPTDFEAFLPLECLALGSDTLLGKFVPPKATHPPTLPGRTREKWQTEGGTREASGDQQTAFLNFKGGYGQVP